MTRVALLWHMHQPFYQDLATGEHVLPWVRLHALKDYWGMVALLGEFPEVRVTFNLVPSLLVQLDSFARDEAHDWHLQLGLKPAEELTDDDRTACIEQFFHAHRPRMIEPYPRYAELLARREAGGAFATADLRDLQVWHKLAWIDPFYLDADARVRALIQKERDYTEEDKGVLRSVELELLRKVIPEYRDAQRRGQVELSTSPFYHPILPLLCDTDVYRRTHPESRVPTGRFARPDDALEQLARAVTLHHELFGEPPAGLWPSEGSVSDAMIPLVARAGFRWMATDEEILARTIGRPLVRDGSGHLEQPEWLYRAYQVGAESRVSCAFRDHALSDLIGFTYASWPADAAADDFIRRVREAGARYAARAGGEEATVFVILDGENAWEHYDGQGRPFLRALYARLASSPDLRSVTMAEACADAREPLPSIFPGSWIDGDFYIWIGHADDQRAWGQLADARRALDLAAPGMSPAGLARAREELLIAEGSDWFWWYGDDHSSDHDLQFDELFRRHLRNAYRALERPIPAELFATNITTSAVRLEIHRPTGFLTPEIDGRETDYFEWLGSGLLEVEATVGAMHQVSERPGSVASVHFGFDAERLFLRVDGTIPMRDLVGVERLQLAVKFLKPAGLRVVIAPHAPQSHTMRVRLEGQSGEAAASECPEALAALDDILEAQVPFACLGVQARDAVSFFVELIRDGVEVEHHPRHRPFEFVVPGRQFPAHNWIV